MHNTCYAYILRIPFAHLLYLNAKQMCWNSLFLLSEYYVDKCKEKQMNNLFLFTIQFYLENSFSFILAVKYEN